MELKKNARKENIVVLVMRDEPGLCIEVHDLEHGIDVMAETAPKHDIKFMGNIEPENEGFYIKGFQIVDAYDKCIRREGVEEYGVTENNWDLECHMCDGYNCLYEPSRKLVLHEDEI